MPVPHPGPKCAIQNQNFEENQGYANFWTDRSKENVPNYALDSVGENFDLLCTIFDAWV